ncbi:hypothetical protein Y032_0350g3228 [Ancylostoma ceylanicum]|uniref:Peptidase S1 domain-containing protein n=1 Tax=Ancylostoma ceylanicum TaxID=53326 RepID=A0A016RXJ0_9BILA|nr:hypothetical protein Y032_0350g3228 [Ancylostoma ceylanicum]
MSDLFSSSLVTINLSGFHPVAVNRRKVVHSKTFDIHSGYSEELRGDPDLAIVFIASPFKCKALSGPAVALLPPQIVQKAGRSNVEDHITEKEIANALCFATGWGLTESGEFAATPQTMYLRVLRDESGALLGYPTQPITRACQGKTIRMGLATDHSASWHLQNINRIKTFCRENVGQRYPWGDSGSPVYCLIRGKKYLIGVVTDIGSFNEIDPDVDDLMRCKLYDLVIISDIRANADEIVRILNARGKMRDLMDGQENCHKLH